MIDHEMSFPDGGCSRRFTGGLPLLPALACLALFLLPAQAFALGQGGLWSTILGGSNNIIETILCEVAGVFQGMTGKAIASVAVMGLGGFALYGKLDKGWATAIIAGIAILFGAGSVVTSFGGNGEACTFSDINLPDFQCVDGIAVPTVVGVVANLFGDGGASPDGDATNCSTYSTTGIFGSVLCYFKSTVGQVMTTMYCAMQNQLIAPLGAVITLLIVVLGITTITGMTAFTIKDIAKFLFKLALVWTFTLNSTWAISIAYKFFMGVAEEGSDIVLSALTPLTQANTPADASYQYQAPSITQPDSVVQSMFGFLTGGGNLAGVDPVVEQQCGASIGVLLAMMAVFMPIIPTFALIMAIQYIGLYARAMLGYLTAIVIISFLFILSPIFISFALFKITYDLFDQWARLLASFALQVIIIFGFLALMGLVLGPITDFFVNMLNLLRAYDQTMNIDVFNVPYKNCGICQYTLPVAGDALGYPTCTGTPPTNPPLVGYLPSMDNTVNVIPLSNMMQHYDLIVYVIGHVFALWLIANILQSFLKNAPEFARALGGSRIATSLAGPMQNDTAMAGNIDYLGGGIDAVQSSLEGAASRLSAGSLPRTALTGLALGAAGLVAGGASAGARTSSGSGASTTARSTPGTNVQSVRAADAELQAALADVKNLSPTMQPNEYALALARLDKADADYMAVASQDTSLLRQTVASGTRRDVLQARSMLKASGSAATGGGADTGGAGTDDGSAQGRSAAATQARPGVGQPVLARGQDETDNDRQPPDNSEDGMS